MPGGLAAALAGLGLLGAVQTTPFVAARAEVDAGVAPEAPTEPTKPSMIIDLRPAAGARFTTPRSTLDVMVLPRFFLQTPNPTNTERPLMLVRADSAHRYEVSPQFAWQSYLGVYAGEVNYTNQALITNTAVARNLDQAVVSAANVEGRTGFVWQTSAVTSLTLMGLAQYTAPLTERSKINLPPTTVLGFEIADGWQTSVVNRFQFPLRMRRYYVKAGIDTIQLETGVDDRLSLSERDVLSTSVGISYSDAEQQNARFLPTASVALERVIYSTRAAAVTNRIAASVTSAYDPTNAQVYPIGGLQAVVGGQLGTSWRPYAAVDAFTTLTNKGVTNTTIIDETGRATGVRSQDSRFSAVMALGYRLNTEFTLEVGARASAFAPNLNERFGLFDYQLFGFVALTFALDLPLGGVPGTQAAGATGMMAPVLMGSSAAGGTPGGMGSGGR